MNKEYHIGQCLFCHQGMLEIVKEKTSGKIFVACDECEAEWENPEDALKKVNGTRGKYGAVSGITLNEIQALHWDKYIR
jgi:hypothetical protein